MTHKERTQKANEQKRMNYMAYCELIVESFEYLWEHKQKRLDLIYKELSEEYRKSVPTIKKITRARLKEYKQELKNRV